MNSIQKFVASFVKRLSKVGGSTLGFSGNLDAKVIRVTRTKKRKK